MIFSKLAPTYEADFSETEIGKFQRNRVYKYIQPRVNTPGVVWEWGCGTGRDAAWFFQQGWKVYASDVAEGMLQVAQVTHPGPIYSQWDIKSPTGDMPSCNLIYSNFGALNCLSPFETSRLGDWLRSRLASDLSLMVVIMPDACIWERLYFRWKGDVVKAKRRRNSPVQFEDISIYYYSAEQWVSLLGPGFKLMKKRPVGLFVPPSYLNGFFVRNRLIASILKGLDVIFSVSFLSRYADHCWMEVRYEK